MQTRTEQEAAIRHYYNHIVAKEERRFNTYPFEFAVTLRFIRQYLAPGAKMLDVACGTGRYAEALLAEEYVVGASDLAEANVQYTHRRLHAGPYGARVLFVRQRNALDPAAYAGGPWEGILLLRPCYHLPVRHDRVAVLQQSQAHPTPGGFLYVSFVSRIAVFWWGLRHRPEGILEQEGVHTLYHEGTTFNFALPGEGFPSGYFCDPGELEPLFQEAGLVVRHVCGTEGVFGGHVARFHELEASLQEAWFQFTVAHCEAPVFRWTSEHLLVVAPRV